MSSPTTGIMTGTFTSNGAARNIAVPFGPQDFELINITDIGSAGAATPVMKARWTSAMLNGSAYYSTKTNGAATLDLEAMTLTNGFSVLTGLQTVGAPVALTVVSQAAGAVVTTGTTPAIGSIVRIYGTTQMLQIAGMDFTVTAVNPGVTMTLGYLDSSAFAAAANAGNYRLVSMDSAFYPRNRYITSITQAASAVITMSVTHNFTVGQEVRILVPAEFGMTEMNNQLATITAINTGTNTITVNVNSTGFTPFAYPTSAIAAGGVTFPQVVPVGEAATVPYQNLLDDATRNTAFTGITIGTTVQTTAKVYQWIARRGTV